MDNPTCRCLATDRHAPSLPEHPNRRHNRSPGSNSPLAEVFQATLPATPEVAAPTLRRRNIQLGAVHVVEFVRVLRDDQGQGTSVVVQPCATVLTVAAKRSWSFDARKTRIQTLDATVHSGMVSTHIRLSVESYVTRHF